LGLPARVEVKSPVQKQVFDFRTRDISAGGAFIAGSVQIARGTEVHLDITVENERLRQLTGCHSLIRVKGRVQRSNSDGIAIRFDKDYQIMCLNSH